MRKTPNKTRHSGELYTTRILRISDEPPRKNGMHIPIVNENAAQRVNFRKEIGVIPIQRPTSEIPDWINFEIDYMKKASRHKRNQLAENIINKFRVPEAERAVAVEEFGRTIGKIKNPRMLKAYTMVFYSALYHDPSVLVQRAAARELNKLLDEGRLTMQPTVRAEFDAKRAELRPGQ